VDDTPACAFATTFYDALLAGRRFIEAVAEAREAAASFGGNTWAAYQCYGDPDWTFRVGSGDAQRPARPLTDELAGVASPANLELALTTLAVRSRFQGAEPDDQEARLRHLEARFTTRWGGIGSVAEAFGAAWAEAGNPQRAIEWYERALAANDGTASFKAAEQLANLSARAAWREVESTGSRAGAAALQRARRAIGDALADLERLVALEPSMEREALCGSACKRLAMVERSAGRVREEGRALALMRDHYQRAESLGRAQRLSGFFYPALNRIAAELAIDAGRAGWKGLDQGALEALREALAVTVTVDPDVWSIAGQVELTLYEAVAREALAASHATVESAYADLHARVQTPHVWRSIRDQAQFVLQRYVPRAPAADRRAATRLLAQLDAFAAVDAASITTSTKRPARKPRRDTKTRRSRRAAESGIR
jgi:hypothetical protein